MRTAEQYCWLCLVAHPQLEVAILKRRLCLVCCEMQALNYLHNMGVVHMDVKSNNVLLTSVGWWTRGFWVVDCGLPEPRRPLPADAHWQAWTAELASTQTTPIGVRYFISSLLSRRAALPSWPMSA